MATWSTTAGVFIDESPMPQGTIARAPTGVAAFLDDFGGGPVNQPTLVASFAEFERIFGGLRPPSDGGYAVRQYFANGGDRAVVVGLGAPGPASAASLEVGLHTLAAIPAGTFDLLCVPGLAHLEASRYPDAARAITDAARGQRAFALLDPPLSEGPGPGPREFLAGTWASLSGRSADAAVWFPAITTPDPLSPTQWRTVGPSGSIAGLIARTDREHGPWQAPAGNEAVLVDAKPVQQLRRPDVDLLNPHGVNALRTSAAGDVVPWGARTLCGDDALGSEWKYVPVRRTALLIESSLANGLQWVVFEPNTEPLWARVIAEVDEFLGALWRDGALHGTRPQDAWFVHCGRGTSMTQDDLDHGRLVINIGFAPLRPAEFVIVSIERRVQPA